jgi:glutathione S-transferase
MILYTWTGSPICRPIQMFIADHKIRIEQRFVDLVAGEQFSPSYARINPNGAVPVLDDGSFRLTEASAILKYLAEKVRSPAYPKALKPRAQVNSVMDWANTGLYRTFGYGFCYPQVLDTLKWPDPNTQAQVLAANRESAKRIIGVMNDHLLGGRWPWLCGDRITIADYYVSGILSLGELIGCQFSEWPRVRGWYRQMQTLPNWKSANAALYAWADSVKGPDYLRL